MYVFRQKNHLGGEGALARLVARRVGKLPLKGSTPASRKKKPPRSSHVQSTVGFWLRQWATVVDRSSHEQRATVYGWGGGSEVFSICVRKFSS